MTQVPTDPETAPSEPLITVGWITSVVTAALGLLVAYGLHVSGGQQSAILGVVAVVAPLVVALIGRARVYSPATVARLIRRR